MPLTVREIDSAKPREKPFKLFDGGGLFLQVNPDGSKRWRFKYSFGGKEKLLSEGVYPGVSLKTARERRDADRKLLAEGKDPSLERKSDKRSIAAATGNTFQAVATQYVEHQTKLWSAKHLASQKRRLELNLFPYLGHRPIAEITALELIAVLRKIENRDAHEMTHRVAQLCGQIWAFAVLAGAAPHNVALGVGKALVPSVGEHMNAVAPDELPELLAAIETSGADMQTRIGLCLLALLFCRTGELIAAEWSEFDFTDALWTIPAVRMKGPKWLRVEHLVPLSRQAVAALEELRILNGRNKFLFPGRNPAQHMSNNTMLYALYRMGYKDRMTGHGFRAVASSILNEESPFKSDVIEKQLAHKERNKTRGAYNRAEYLPQRRELMQWWGDRLDQARAPSAPAGG